MTTSGTSTFDPAAGELILYAYSLCGIRRTALVAEHMADARMALNLLISSWGNDTPNLWTVELETVDLVEGTATYNVDADTIMILDAYIRTGDDSDPQNYVDRIIWPLSRTEYAAQPNKSFRAPPTTFWFNRQLAPTITLWQVPDATSSADAVNRLLYYRCKVIQDAAAAGGVTMDVPRWWLDAVAWGLAARLAVSYAADRAAALKIEAKEAYANAKEQDTENVNLFILPGIHAYFPR